MAALVAEPQTTPAPISFDHAIMRAVDVGAGFEFASRVMGLKKFARIVAPDAIPVLGFFRCHTLYHCYGAARSPVRWAAPHAVHVEEPARGAWRIRAHAKSAARSS